MVNPLSDALEVWLAIFNNLPNPILALISLSLGLFIFLVLFRIVYHIRS